MCHGLDLINKCASRVMVQLSGESVAQSKSTHSRKPELSTSEHGHQMDGWPLCARLCAHPEISSESKFCADSTKILWMRLIN